MLNFVFFNFRNLQVWILGFCQTEIQPSKSKSLQNEPKRLNKAFTDSLRCLGGPPESPIDISCILTRSEFFRMPYLPVINLVIIFYYRKLLHQSKKLLHRVFTDPEVINFKNKIVSPKSILYLHNVLFIFGSDCFESECHCNLCNKSV